MLSILPHISLAFLVMGVAYVFSSDGYLLASLFVITFVASKFGCTPLLARTAQASSPFTPNEEKPKEAKNDTVPLTNREQECLTLVAHQYLPKLTLQLDNSRNQTQQAMTSITADFGDLNERLSQVLDHSEQSMKEKKATEQLLASILTELQFHDRVDQIQACTSEGLVQLAEALTRYQESRTKGEDVTFQTKDIDLALSKMSAETQKQGSQTDGDRLTYF